MVRAAILTSFDLALEDKAGIGVTPSGVSKADEVLLDADRYCAYLEEIVIFHFFHLPPQTANTFVFDRHGGGNPAKVGRLPAEAREAAKGSFSGTFLFVWTSPAFFSVAIAAASSGRLYLSPSRGRPGVTVGSLE